MRLSGNKISKRKVYDQNNLSLNGPGEAVNIPSNYLRFIVNSNGCLCEDHLDPSVKCGPFPFEDQRNSNPNSAS